MSICEACDYIFNQASFKAYFMFFQLQNAKQGQAWEVGENRRDSF